MISKTKWEISMTKNKLLKMVQIPKLMRPKSNNSKMNLRQSSEKKKNLITNKKNRKNLLSKNRLKKSNNLMRTTRINSTNSKETNRKKSWKLSPLLRNSRKSKPKMNKNINEKSRSWQKMPKRNWENWINNVNKPLTPKIFVLRNWKIVSGTLLKKTKLQLKPLNKKRKKSINNSTKNSNNRFLTLLIWNFVLNLSAQFKSKKLIMQCKNLETVEKKSNQNNMFSMDLSNKLMKFSKILKTNN